MIISLKNVSKKYQNSDFKLNNISFNIQKKEIIGIIGKNGTGKSTILKMINGLISYDSGHIFYKDKKLKDMNDDELRKMRKNVSYIFQNANLLEGETVFYNLSLVYKVNRQKVNTLEIDKILNFMGISNLKNTLCRNISGGQQQKVAIAMSLLQNPEVLLCDEISSALDSNSEKEIFDLLIKLKNTTDISILLISHNLSILKNFCDKVLIIENSTIKDIIKPINSKSNHYEENYIKHVKDFLLYD
ncbi:ATP-binding cassette domain-containing protein [Gemella sp. GH3]|uniref:ATP-binding cassette domain-containing protein n=1 Tax=unclassified Gemella TaxID=2624949 RepID=UPI0015D0C2A9|nr:MULTISPECIES: ATP-binding cassette domain-containing protein [unclassified Gemella]MBF0714214.1 ATP-binding cassette domain-containing protein [Gemella sp. GH3.1]NYS51166.1 ATP-binding cassette domain-containing protein [Gemella sp. GH3]